MAGRTTPPSPARHDVARMEELSSPSLDIWFDDETVNHGHVSC